MIVTIDAIKSLIAKRTIKDDNGCWVWTGSRMPTGYGDFRMDRKHFSAHRAAFAAFIGAIPPGMHVLHKCDVKACCNPEHLFIGTNLDNIRDSQAKGRRKGITRRRPSGLKYVWTKTPGPPPKLSEIERLLIRESYLVGSSMGMLARRHGVGITTIWNYLRGR